MPGKTWFHFYRGCQRPLRVCTFGIKRARCDAIRDAIPGMNYDNLALCCDSETKYEDQRRDIKMRIFVHFDSSRSPSRSVCLFALRYAAQIKPSSCGCTVESYCSRINSLFSPYHIINIKAEIHKDSKSQQRLTPVIRSVWFSAHCDIRVEMQRHDSRCQASAELNAA